MAPDEFNYDDDPFTRAGDIQAANASIDNFVAQVSRGELPPSLNAVTEAMLLLAYIGGLNGSLPKAIKMLSSKRGVNYGQLAKELGPFQRLINARIADLREDIQAEKKGQAVRDRIAITGEDDVPF